MTAQLLDRLSVGALERAWRRVRSPGDPAPDLGLLLRDVRHGRYRPGRPYVRHLAKSGGGTRRLTVPAVRDRVLQRAVLDALPASVRRMQQGVHGYVRGRSVHTGIRHLLRAVGRRPWLEIVQIDVTNLFDALEHARLLEAVRERWPDPVLTRLCHAWCRAYGDAGRGVGQGGPLSPWLANVYLDRHLDPATAVAADAGWLRYGDDVTAVTAQPGGALCVFAALELACHAVGLAVSMRKVAVCAPPEGGVVRVLGYDLALEPRGRDWMLRCLRAGPQPWVEPGGHSRPALVRGGGMRYPPFPADLRPLARSEVAP